MALVERKLGSRPVVLPLPGCEEVAEKEPVPAIGLGELVRREVGVTPVVELMKVVAGYELPLGGTE